MGNFIWILIYILHWATCDEIYQNSSHICDECICSDKESFILDCNNQNFQHVLANWPEHNKTLIATFSYNNITTLGKLPISEYKAKLVFDHCGIQYLDRGVFSNIKNVEYIDLSYNLLKTEEIAGDDFKGPYSNKSYRPIAVKYLNLAYNQIHSLPRKFFENMPDLEELNLEGNYFEVLDPNTQVALGSLTKIKILNLANNDLTELESELLRNLQTLTELDVSSNHLDYVPEQLDYVHKNLKILKLSHNYIFQLTDQSFLGLDLIELHLNNLTRLNVIEANTFVTQKNLKRLYISGNSNLRVIDKEAFGDNQKLDELDLSNNSLNDINYNLNWTNLKVLKIDSNPLDCTCSLYNITKALPKSITRIMGSPMCTNKEDSDISQRVYQLDIGVCSEVRSAHITKVMKSFNTIRIVLITLSSLLLVVTIIAIAVAVLRYKKKIAFRTYPFSVQVSYNPIHN